MVCIGYIAYEKTWGFREKSSIRETKLFALLIVLPAVPFVGRIVFVSLFVNVVLHSVGKTILLVCVMSRLYSPSHIQDA